MLDMGQSKSRAGLRKGAIGVGMEMLEKKYDAEAKAGDRSPTEALLWCVWCGAVPC
jgi:hypothetical protein